MDAQTLLTSIESGVLLPHDATDGFISNEVCDWATALDTILDIPKVEPCVEPNKTKRKRLSSHRLLTSEEIIQEKRRNAEEKEEKECLKQERKQIREIKKKQKQDKENIDIKRE